MEITKPKYIDPERLSIEQQVAVKALVELRIHNIELPTDLNWAVEWWCREKLQPYLGLVQSKKGDKKNDRDNEANL